MTDIDELTVGKQKVITGQAEIYIPEKK